jgi:hypothetical protein
VITATTIFLTSVRVRYSSVLLIARDLLVQTNPKNSNLRIYSSFCLYALKASLTNETTGTCTIFGTVTYEMI